MKDARGFTAEERKGVLRRFKGGHSRDGLRVCVCVCESRMQLSQTGGDKWNMYALYWRL